MDPAAPMEEAFTRPRRETRLPSHLTDYEVDYSVHSSHPLNASSRSVSKHGSSSRRAHSSVSGFSSHSGRHTAYSVGRYPQDGLSPIQAAILEENAKQQQLDNHLRQMEEEAQAERELQQIQAQAKAAQQAQEEALQAREALSKRLDQSRRLQKLQTDVELAKLVTSMLSTNSTSSSTYQPLPPATASPAPVRFMPSSAQLSPAPLQPAIVPPRQHPAPVQSAPTAQYLPAVALTDNSVEAAVPPVSAQQPTTTHQGLSFQQQGTVNQELTPAVPINAKGSSQPSTHPIMQPHVVPYYNQLPAAQPPPPIADHRWEQPPAASYPIQAPLPARSPYPGLQPISRNANCLCLWCPKAYPANVRKRS